MRVTGLSVDYCPFFFIFIPFFLHFFCCSWYASDKKLFTPGPLGVSLTVKEAMLRDLGSRDIEFINLVKLIRSRLLQIAGTITHYSRAPDERPL